jgi:hypothetical protein
VLPNSWWRSGRAVALVGLAIVFAGQRVHCRSKILSFPISM